MRISQNTEIKLTHAAMASSGSPMPKSPSSRTIWTEEAVDRIAFKYAAFLSSQYCHRLEQEPSKVASLAKLKLDLEYTVIYNPKGSDHFPPPTDNEEIGLANARRRNTYQITVEEVGTV